MVLHLLALTLLATAAAGAETVDESRFATTEEVKHLTDKICGGGIRLPGGEAHLRKVAFIESQLEGICGLEITKDGFELQNWEPVGNSSMYQAAGLKIEGNNVDVAAAIAYSLPTNGSYVTGELYYLGPGDNISAVDMKGKILVRDYSILAVPVSIITSSAYYASPDAANTSTYARPFISPPHADLLAASLGGAAGYISAFNVSRAQLESYYSGHSGTHWLVPGIFTGAEQYDTIREAAARNATAAIRIDATTGTVHVPRIHATLPGMSNETIVIATHTDGDTYVQENGPSALLTLVRYFASLPMESRKKTLQFAFEASHLAYQLDSDKLLAKSLDATYDNDNDTTAFVIAIEHLGTREIGQFPATDGAPGNKLQFTGRGETVLWAVGPVSQAITAVVGVVQNRNLDNIAVTPGFPPKDTSRVPDYFSFGGLGSYYHTALVPTMALISGPWSLWAPSFGAEALDYDRLRAQHIAIGDTILALSEYSKEELAGNYTNYRLERLAGAETSGLNDEYAQFITDPNLVYY